MLQKYNRKEISPNFKKVVDKVEEHIYNRDKLAIPLAKIKG